MTEPTPVPDDAGGGAHTVTTRSSSRVHTELGTSTNGDRVNGSARPDDPAHPRSRMRGVDAESAGDQRSADEIEAGIVALWQAFGEHRDQELRDRLVLHYAPLVK